MENSNNKNLNIAKYQKTKTIWKFAKINQQFEYNASKKVKLLRISHLSKKYQTHKIMN